MDADERIHKACRKALDGYDLVYASEGEDALGKFDSVPAAAVITELVLEGGMDGLTLVDRLRQRDPDIAALVLTDHPSAQTAVRALRLSVDEFLIKQSDSMSQLRQAVREAIRERTRRAELVRVLGELTELTDAFLSGMQALQKENLELGARLDAREAGGGSAPRVLVIDDEVAIVALIEALLRSQGYEVDGANSGAEARALLADSRYDVVLTDKNLGDADGVELIAEVHRRAPETRVLLMTGYATVDSAVNAVNLGAAGYLRKPFEDLGVVINRVEELMADLKREREEVDYVRAFRERHGDFLARYRMVQMKVATLVGKQT